MKYSLILILSLTILQGCSMHGVYTTNPKGRPAFAGQEIILSKENKISIDSWTDVFTRSVDSDGNIIWADKKYKGNGTFIQQGDSLHVTFLNEDSLTITIDKKDIGERKHYEVRISDELGHKMDPIFNLKNDSLEAQKTIWEQKTSVGIFNTTPRTNYAYIGFGDITMFTPKIDIPIADIETGKNVFKYKTYAGYYAKGDKVTVYCKKARSGIRYGPDRRWLPKKYKLQFLNRFYK